MHDHLLRVNGQVEQFRELLSTALGANLTQISVRQNEDMRRITAWVAIAAVPTAVAGIYGMNFDHMPELQWEFGYPAGAGRDRGDLPLPLRAVPARRLALGNLWFGTEPGEETRTRQRARPIARTLLTCIRIFLSRTIRWLRISSLSMAAFSSAPNSSATFVSHSQPTSTIAPQNAP